VWVLKEFLLKVMMRKLKLKFKDKSEAQVAQLEGLMTGVVTMVAWLQVLLLADGRWQQLWDQRSQLISISVAVLLTFSCWPSRGVAWIVRGLALTAAATMATLHVLWSSSSSSGEQAQEHYSVAGASRWLVAEADSSLRSWLADTCDSDAGQQQQLVDETGVALVGGWIGWAMLCSLVLVAWPSSSIRHDWQAERQSLLPQNVSRWAWRMLGLAALLLQLKLYTNFSGWAYSFGLAVPLAVAFHKLSALRYLALAAVAVTTAVKYHTALVEQADWLCRFGAWLAGRHFLFEPQELIAAVGHLKSSHCTGFIGTPVDLAAALWKVVAVVVAAVCERLLKEPWVWVQLLLAAAAGFLGALFAKLARSTSGNVASEKRAGAVFEHFDKDDSGEFDEHELESIMKELGKSPSKAELKAAFDEMDKNKSGQVSGGALS
jgi:hypothetical protein